MKISFLGVKKMACILFCVSSLVFFSPSHAFTITISSDDVSTTTVFSNVGTFQFVIDVDASLEAGEYNDPMLNEINYEVSGTLVSGTPSGFPAFELVRDIDGVDFYAQGSSLWFEISGSADLSDGLQTSELVPNSEDEIFVFNGREIDNGRFHPALFVLSSDGTGRIQNSNNEPVLGGALVPFGAEYITDIVFDLASLTIVEGESSRSSGGGATSWWLIALLAAAGGVGFIQGLRRRPKP